MMHDIQPSDILFYWFGELVDGDVADADARHALWFGSRPEDDQDMQEKFAPLIEQALNGDLEHWRQTPNELMAYIILLDQMTRATKRGTAAAFGGDSKALAACQQGITYGMDQQMQPIYRRFFYLPLEHSENIADQRQCVALFAAAQKQMPEYIDMFADSEKYAIAHLKIIEKFARFPHRNAIVGREDTADEALYLKENPGAHFGQKSKN